jgi:UDP-glucose 4-epimerase
MDLIEQGLKVTGYNVIPNLKSFKIKDLFEIYNEEFNLEYTLGTPRISEKLHEMMISKEELPRTHYNSSDNIYYMHYKETQEKWDTREFTSDIVCMSKNELKNLLKTYNYFKP